MSGIMKKIKLFLSNHPKVLYLITCLFNHLPFNNFVRNKKGNNICLMGIVKKSNITFYGKNNSVIVEEGAILKNCTITIKGNNNKIIFKTKSYAKFADLVTEDNDNYIELGKNSSLAGKIHLACIEGTKIIIGEDCLFSSEIIFRTGDSHSIIDSAGNRLNFSKDIVIGNHVWIGNRAIITKGVNIADNTIVGTGAIVTRSIERSNCTIAGVPAVIVKENVNWKHERC